MSNIISDVDTSSRYQIRGKRTKEFPPSSSLCYIHRIVDEALLFTYILIVSLYLTATPILLRGAI
jgi:hypothetical protein